MEIFALASATSSAVNAIDTMKRRREGPKPQQAAKAPKVAGNLRDRRGASGGPAYGMQTPSLLSSGSTKGNSLLGS